MTVPLSKAIQAAKAFVREQYQTEGIGDLLLEEVRMDEAGKDWLITLGFTPPWATRGMPAVFSAAHPSRSYKVFRVHGVSGEVIEMTIRDPKA